MSSLLLRNDHLGGWGGPEGHRKGVARAQTALVYVAARAPDAGEDYTALAKNYPTPPATAGIDSGRAALAAAAPINVRRFIIVSC